MKLLKLVPDNTNLDFMRWRNVGLMLSIILTVASLSLVAVRGLNLGVDFVGGQMIRVTFAKQVDVEKLRSDVGSINVGDASIQETGGPRSYQIRLPKPEGGEAAANRAIASDGPECLRGPHRRPPDQQHGRAESLIWRCRTRRLRC